MKFLKKMRICYIVLVLMTMLNFLFTRIKLFSKNPILHQIKNIYYFALLFLIILIFVYLVYLKTMKMEMRFTYIEFLNSSTMSIAFVYLLTFVYNDSAFTYSLLSIVIGFVGIFAFVMSEIFLNILYFKYEKNTKDSYILFEPNSSPLSNEKITNIAQIELEKAKNKSSFYENQKNNVSEYSKKSSTTNKEFSKGNFLESNKNFYDDGFMEGLQQDSNMYNKNTIIRKSTDINKLNDEFLNTNNEINDL